MRLILVLALVLVASVGRADTLSGGLPIGTSVSQSYDGRSIFTNPAAMGFQTDLNGTDLATSFLYGFNRNLNDDFALGATLGYFGFGWERLLTRSDTLSRFRFGFGIPLHPQWFVGTRYVLNRFDNAQGFDTVDFGLQFRPSRWASLGLLANGINQPTVGGAPLPWQLVGGLTLRPLPRIELVLDADTYSGDSTFFQRFGYQTSLAVEPIAGIKLRAGYHNLYQFQCGIEVRLGRSTLFSDLEPSSDLHNVVAGFDLTATPYRSAITEPAVLKIAINGQLEERPSSNSLFASWHPTLLDLLEKLEQASQRAEIHRVVIRLESFPLGLAAAEEVHQAIRRLRASGKPVDAYLGNAGLKEYLIATAASRIHLAPQGELKLLGLHSERYYLKGTLDKLGIEGEFLARGEYKSAPEMFTRRDSSPVNRQATLEDLHEANRHLSGLLAMARPLNAAAWKKVFDSALFGAESAQQAGLVDSIDSYGAKNDDDEIAATAIDERSNALALPARVAVIVAEGDIMQHKMRALSLGGESQVTPPQMLRQFETALADRRTAAIVLRVNSPGGEILPSHEIAEMVEKARKRKPLVVSMGDVAASGGYYIAAPGERLFAGPLTLTGSIGVFLGKVNAAGLFKWLQLNKEILSEFPHAALFSEDRPWNADDRAILTRRLNEYYSGFVSYVATHRQLSAAAAESAAKGRVWLGTQALQHKLVDETGGYHEAVRAAAELAGIGEDYEVRAIQDAVGLFDLFSDVGILGRAPSLTRELAGILSPGAFRDLRWIASLREEPFLYLSPLAFVAH